MTSQRVRREKENSMQPRQPRKTRRELRRASLDREISARKSVTQPYGSPIGVTVSRPYLIPQQRNPTMVHTATTSHRRLIQSIPTPQNLATELLFGSTLVDSPANSMVLQSMSMPHCIGNESSCTDVEGITPTPPESPSHTTSDVLPINR